MTSLPGYQWRTLAHHDNGTEIAASSGTDPVCFDELVIDDWFHLEQMDDRDWHLIIGHRHFHIHIHDNSQTATLIDEGEVDVHGCTTRIETS